MTKPLLYDDFIGEVETIRHPFGREIYSSPLALGVGEGACLWYNTGGGIALAHRHFKLQRDSLLEESSTIPGAVFIFNLASPLRFIYPDGKELFLPSMHFFLEFASAQFSVQTPFSAKEEQRFIFIAMKEGLFLPLAKSVEGIDQKMQNAHRQGYDLLPPLAIDPKQLEWLAFLQSHDSYRDTLPSLQLESKITALLHHTLERFLPTHSSLEPERLTACKRAWELIFTDYHRADLSIREIARRAATNECYLKRDFKLCYGMTILSAIQERRLEVAKELLERGASLQEAIKAVGYKHASHFAKLFFKRFNHTPHDYQKRFHLP